MSPRDVDASFLSVHCSVILEFNLLRPHHVATRPAFLCATLKTRLCPWDEAKCQTYNMTLVYKAKCYVPAPLIADGKVLFIVELQPMCRLLTPNLSPVGMVAHITDSRSPATKRRGSSRMLGKRLSFLRAVKHKPVQHGLGNSRLQSQSNDENSSPYSSEGVPSEFSQLHVDVQNSRVKIFQSHSICENSIPHSNCSVSSLSSVSPAMVALGLVRQADLPLTWLDQTAVYSCNGLYVPRETRSKLHSKTKSSLLNHAGIIEDKNTDHSSAGCSLGDPSTSTKRYTDEKSMAPHTPLSSSFHGLNLTPVLRLNRCPLSSLDSRQSLSSCRLRRSSSVPKEMASSSSGGLSPVGDEVKKNDTKRFQLIKRSVSLPSSPVVFCSKLPLAKLRNPSHCSRNDESSSPASGRSLSRPLPPIVLSPKLKLGKVKEFQVTLKKSGEQVQEQEHAVSQLEMCTKNVRM